ncbi:gamma-thionin family protein [Medicago truncatula]|uniref:Gamma-thionin family protein n=2 Tax=Medicago truncatula TaxID=3880 RepID=G7LDH3_MEDTR|nr:gamma-thionin family protein [Medicago truncatula]AFK46462.1 unknown [Medicago truncatula]
MERKSIVSICFFLVILLTSQKQVVHIEAYCEKQSRNFIGQCLGLIGDKLCYIICVTKENSISGSCQHLRCICSHAC